MLDISEILLSFHLIDDKREERFCIVGEDDGIGSIVFRKQYLYNPKRKSRSVKIPVREFLGTAIWFIDGIYRAQYLPPEKCQSEAVCRRKLKRLKRYLNEDTSEK